jgi:hypothetical protein
MADLRIRHVRLDRSSKPVSERPCPRRHVGRRSRPRPSPALHGPASSLRGTSMSELASARANAFQRRAVAPTSIHVEPRPGVERRANASAQHHPAVLPLALASASCPHGQAEERADRRRTREPSKASSKCAAAHIPELECVNVSRARWACRSAWHGSSCQWRKAESRGETRNIFKKPSAVACVCTVLAKPGNCCTCK